MAMIRGKKSKIQIILIVVSLIFLVAFIVFLRIFINGQLFIDTALLNVSGIEYFNIVTFVITRDVILIVLGLLTMAFLVANFCLLSLNIEITENVIKGKTFWRTKFDLRYDQIKRVDVSPFHGLNIYLEDDRLSLCGLANNKEICEAINSLMHGEIPQVEKTISPQVVSEATQDTKSMSKEAATNTLPKLFCTKCGAEILSAGKFCAKCGNSINGR